MDITRVLSKGKELQASVNDSNEQADSDVLYARIRKGLSWLIEHYAFTTAQGEAKWNEARAQFKALCDRWDQMNGYPQGFSLDVLNVAVAWLRADPKGPAVVALADGTRARVSVGGYFQLPLTDPTAEYEFKLKREGSDKPQDVIDLSAALELFEARRAYFFISPNGTVDVADVLLPLDRWRALPKEGPAPAS